MEEKATNYAGSAPSPADLIGTDPAADYETALTDLDKCYKFMQDRFGGAVQDSRAAECTLLLNRSITTLRAGAGIGAGHVVSAR